MQHLREHHPTVKVSVEVENPSRKGLRELAALSDVVFYSKSWAQVRFVVFANSLESKQLQGNGYESSKECLHAEAYFASKA